jgi:hypothetical protein
MAHTHHDGASNTNQGNTLMFTKTIIALFAALALFSSASFDSGAKAQGDCDTEWGSAYARPRC